MKALKDLVKKLIGEKGVRGYHLILSLLACVFYRFPAKSLKVVAITGTKGKSSTSYFLFQILNKSGKKAGLISTPLWSFDGKKEIVNNKHMTMPGRFFIQSALSKMRKNRLEFAIVETTSEGIKQFRHLCLWPKAAGFTNLFPEHIESHGSYDAYKKEKAKLFKSLKKTSSALFNKDDPEAEFFASSTKARKFFISSKENADYKIENLKKENGKISFSLNGQNFEIPGFAEFEGLNAAFAAALADILGVPLKDSAEALKTAKSSPGRMEKVYDKDFMVFVDYAHEPKSLEYLLKETKSFAKGRIILLTGSAGGGRDRQKREKMGAVADKYADIVIVANEDPYDEDPAKIIEDVAKGVKNKTLGKTLFKELDRKKAIALAISLAKKGDVVLIAGKGAEVTIMSKEGPVPHNDKEEVLKALNKIGA